MCRHCDTVICSLMLCVWLLYYSCVFTLIQVLMKQAEVKGKILKRNTETQKQMHFTIDGLTKTVAALSQKVEVLCGQPNDVNTCKVGAVTTSKWTAIPPTINKSTFRQIMYFRRPIIRACVRICISRSYPLRSKPISYQFSI